MATSPAATDVIAFMASESAAFHAALAAAVASYAASGVRPKSLLAGGASSALVEAGGGGAGGKKTRAKKDPAAPKRPASAYNVFVKERAADLKEGGFDAKAENTSE